MALIEPWQISTTLTQVPSTFWLWGSDPTDSNTSKKLAVDDLFRTSGAVRDVYVESDGAFRTSVVLHNTAAEWSLRNTSGGTLRFRNEDTTANVFDISSAAHDSALEVNAGGITVMRGSGATDPTFDARVAGAVVNNSASGTFCALAIIAGATGASQIQFGTSADDDFARFGWNHNQGRYEFYREGTATPMIEIDGAAPADSMNMVASGDIGFGANPTTNAALYVERSTSPEFIHIKTSATNGQAGFKAQNDARTWSMYCAVDDSFVIRDETGTNSVFKLGNGAPADSLVIDASGDVMMGDSTARITGLTVRPGGDSGTVPTISDPGVAVINSSTTGKTAAFYAIGGTLGISSLYLGDSAAADVCKLEYDHTNNELKVRANATDLLLCDERGVQLGASTSKSHNGALVLSIINGTAPTSSQTNGVLLYSEDVSASAELKVRDENGTITTLSPHHMEDEIDDLSIALPWTMHHENAHLGLRETVNMAKVVSLVEQLAEAAGLSTEFRKVEEIARAPVEPGQRLATWVSRRLEN